LQKISLAFENLEPTRFMRVAIELLLALPHEERAHMEECVHYDSGAGLAGLSCVLLWVERPADVCCDACAAAVGASSDRAPNRVPLDQWQRQR